ncbi:hypothetical protein BOTBODRAFT_478226 [Botryobasidium botryosum FD-172 SS1]|uniref:Chloride channel protein n=1 Tax=Botryobasidium botryosum (strain FD-172 SS1) TaxID=930990 RepID=A0A067N458_BOTB1|nr:hypothetical protein BOTBODRAFT_478226 [Botryobasidium botryosum FD-172 SS1]
MGDEENIEITGEDEAWASVEAVGRRRVYRQGGTIDWMHEEAAERGRKHQVEHQRGVRSLLTPLLDSWRMWCVIIATGVGVGCIGAWLDVLVLWLADLRVGRCAYGFFYSRSTCCSGLDVAAGEVCNEWLTWSQSFNVTSTVGQILIQFLVYLIFAVLFASSAAILVQSYAPFAFHTGIPEIKAILGGYVLDDFLSPWTLLIKAVGLALAVASGLSLGKEGPLVHIAVCCASLASGFFAPFRNNEAQKRKILAAAAAAGVAVAFGSPLGGVLFGLEELDLFSNEQVMWRAFVTSVIAAVSLQYVDPFGTGKLVLFQVSTSQQPWRAFELIPWLGLGVAGGLLGALFIKINVAVALYRKRSMLREWPLIEVVGVTAITAVLSYMVAFMRVQTSELVSYLFQECDGSRDYRALCQPEAIWSTTFLLLCTLALKLALTAWTFGMKVPAGVFLPTIAAGACLGRAVGLLLQAWHKAHPTAWIFSSCPPEGNCISPGFYAVIGAAALLGGVTRMTVSLVAILFELTGALSHVLPIMISVMASKWVGDAINKEGIYTAWISLHGYSFLPNIEFRDDEGKGDHYIVPASQIITVNGRSSTLIELDTLLNCNNHDGFPVVDGDMLLGYVTRDRLREALDPLMQNSSEEELQSTRCTFLPRPSSDFVGPNLCNTMERAPMQLRQETPMDIIVPLFQKLNLRYVLFTAQGRLTGMMSKRDVVTLMNAGFKDAGALCDRAGAEHPDQGTRDVVWESEASGDVPLR